MAQRRMFSKQITDSDRFLEMPLSSQALYFHLAMQADDDGFLNNAKKIQRMIGASEDDLKLLFAKGFLIAFDSGVVVVRHWKIHNWIQNDRYNPTAYAQELARLRMVNKIYYTEAEAAKIAPPAIQENCAKEQLLDTPCIQDASTLDTDCIQNGSTGKVRLGKVRLDQVSVGEYRGECERGKDPSATPPGAPPKKTKDPDPLESLTGSADLRQAVEDWLTYKREKRQAYKPTGLKTFIRQVNAKAGEFGEPAVIDLIADSMANGYQGVTWDRLRKRQEQQHPAYQPKKTGWQVLQDLMAEEQTKEQTQDFDFLEVDSND